jgi:hypothetical protein
MLNIWLIREATCELTWSHGVLSWPEIGQARVKAY